MFFLPKRLMHLGPRRVFSFPDVIISKTKVPSDDIRCEAQPDPLMYTEGYSHNHSNKVVRTAANEPIPINVHRSSLHQGN